MDILVLDTFCLLDHPCQWLGRTPCSDAYHEEPHKGRNYVRKYTYTHYYIMGWNALEWITMLCTTKYYSGDTLFGLSRSGDNSGLSLVNSLLCCLKSPSGRSSVRSQHFSMMNISQWWSMQHNLWLQVMMMIGKWDIHQTSILCAMETQGRLCWGISHTIFYRSLAYSCWGTPSHKEFSSLHNSRPTLS